MEKFLIIGASSFIGQKLYNFLTERNLPVVGTSRKPTKIFKEFNLENPELIENLNLNQFSTVFIPAAISSPDICSKDFDYAWKINVDLTSIVINKLIERKIKVIFFSSDTVYGEQIDPFDETKECSPIGPYGFMKSVIEKKFEGNILFKAIRLSYVFSSEDKFTKYLINCQNSSSQAEIFHPMKRSVIFINDVMDGLLSLSNKFSLLEEQFINFGGPKNLSRVNFAKILKENHLYNLKYKEIMPKKDFFNSRAKYINMKSPILERIINRKTIDLRSAIKYEFP